MICYCRTEEILNQFIKVWISVCVGIGHELVVYGIEPTKWSVYSSCSCDDVANLPLSPLYSTHTLVYSSSLSSLQTHSRKTEVEKYWVSAGRAGGKPALIYKQTTIFIKKDGLCISVRQDTHPYTRSKCKW